MGAREETSYRSIDQSRLGVWGMHGPRRDRKRRRRRTETRVPCSTPPPCACLRSRDQVAHGTAVIKRRHGCCPTINHSTNSKPPSNHHPTHHDQNHHPNANQPPTRAGPNPYGPRPPLFAAWAGPERAGSRIFLSVWDLVESVSTGQLPQSPKLRSLLPPAIPARSPVGWAAWMPSGPAFLPPPGCITILRCRRSISDPHVDRLDDRSVQPRASCALP